MLGTDEQQTGGNSGDPSRRWWQQAERNLEAAELLGEHGFFNWSCFCAHQAAELALKAVLVKMGRDDLLDKHSLQDLYRAVRRKYPFFRSVRRELRALEWHYLKARYPQPHQGWMAPHDVYNARDAATCIDYARRVLELCRRPLGDEAS